MGWFRLAGTFCDHPKVIAAGNASVGLYVRLGCWSAEHETDGFVPEEVARRFGSRRELSRLTTPTRQGSRCLLDVMEGGYLLRDFLAFNPSHEQKERERALKSRRQARWRARDGDASVDAPPDASVDDASSPLHSMLTVSSLSPLGDARGAERPWIRSDGTVDADALAQAALPVVADLLAQERTTPEKRSAYARGVLRNGTDHLPELIRIAHGTHAITPEFVANSYLGRAQNARNPHGRDCVCLGAGVVYADPDDFSQGVIACPGVTDS